MTPDALFPVVNMAALAGWLTLALAPRQAWSRRLATTIVPVGLSAVYAVLIARFWSTGEGGFGSLGAVAQLFESRWLLLAGWTHYLAFDLLIGSWEVRDASERGIPHLAVIPSLVMTFIFGPAGWLLYGATRALVPSRAAARTP